MWPVRWGSKGGVSHLHTVSGVCMAANRAVTTGIPVQRVVPHSDPWACSLVPVWQLPGEQPKTEGGAPVSVSCHLHINENVCFLLIRQISGVYVCVCNCRLKDRTHSLWAHLLSEQQNYLNPVYSLDFAETHPVLEPSTQPWNFKYIPIPLLLNTHYITSTVEGLLSGKVLYSN